MRKRHIRTTLKLEALSRIEFCVVVGLQLQCAGGSIAAVCGGGSIAAVCGGESIAAVCGGGSITAVCGGGSIAAVCGGGSITAVRVNGRAHLHLPGTLKPPISSVPFRFLQNLLGFLGKGKSFLPFTGIDLRIFGFSDSNEVTVLTE